MMGMGEPLQNYGQLVPALRMMLDDHGYGLSRRRVTVSTSGVVPMIDRLRDDCPVALAVSLHAPDDALRDELVPLNRKYPIAELLASARRYLERAPRDFITIEYCMLDGVNDSPAQAEALARAAARRWQRGDAGPAVQGQPHSVQPVRRVRPQALARRARRRVRGGAPGGRHRHHDSQDARRRHRRGMRPARRRGAGPHARRRAARPRGACSHRSCPRRAAASAKSSPPDAGHDDAAPAAARRPARCRPRLAARRVRGTGTGARAAPVPKRAIASPRPTSPRRRSAHARGWSSPRPTTAAAR